ncbi:MAG: hypothetical protein JSV04_10075 [Candidatus Heimdallarchaeota archaeon]|nr:MAG: hypothetical protein JSV04_10075 [Candidatus Heimdallarchaeota archaeon]
MTKKHKIKPENGIIGNGSWGIFQKPNSTPEERWDPFRTIIDNSETKIGHHTYISTLRGNRPHENSIYQTDHPFNNQKKGEDTFCRLVKGEIPSIVLSRDLSLIKTPFSADPAFEDLRESKVFTTVNLFTPMTRIILPNKNEKLNNLKIAKGIPLLHIFSEHYLSIEEVPEEELVSYLKNIILTVNACKKSITTEGSTLLPVFHFYNIGSKAGASIPHLHSQTYLYANGSLGQGWKHHSFLQSFKKNKQLVDNSFCLGCEYANGIKNDPLGQELHIEDRLIWEDNNWLILTAYAPERDAQLRLLPKRHVSSLWELSPKEIHSLARALRIANSALSGFIDRLGEKYLIYPDRNILFRQHGSTPRIHMLVDIIPVQPIGGAEILDDYRTAHIFPEETARQMKL